ncbi:hypothetical protein BKA93DRAFT_822937 [Sparassis latifolia]
MSFDDCPQPDLLYVMKQGKRIHRGRQTLLTTLKAHHDDLIKEAGFYQDELAAVQGKIVPKFYGIFQGHFGSRFITCTVLKNCGERMSKAHYKNLDFKVELVNRLQHLHSFCGLEHGDVCGGNVLVKDDSPVFIDFEHARPHECKRTMAIEVGKPWPQALDFGCFELHDAGKYFGVWGPAIVEFLDDCISVYQITPPKRLVELTLHNDYVDPEDALEQAQEFVQYLVNRGTLPESVLTNSK